MEKENKIILNLTFLDQYKKVHRLTPKYFKADLTEETVRKVMETITKLENLFIIKDNHGQTYNPYHTVDSASYVTTNTKKIF